MSWTLLPIFAPYKREFETYCVVKFCKIKSSPETGSVLLLNAEIPTIVVNIALHAKSLSYVFFEMYLFRGGLSIPFILCMLSHHSLKCVKKNI